MHIIPVIDLMAGQVVRAMRGQRDLYQPLSTPLCASSDPLAVTEAYLALHSFQTLYVADLDAILERGHNTRVVEALRRHFPELQLWLDAGFRSTSELQAMRRQGIDCVIGSEALQSLDHFQALSPEAEHHSDILSLDFNRQGLLGPQAVMDAPDEWPERLICMTLHQVGSYDGPDMTRLSALRQRAGMRKLYAAGGIRDFDDLQRLNQAGVDGALIASALHDGKITSGEFTNL